MKTHVLFASAVLFAAAGVPAAVVPASAQTLEECLALAREHAPRLRVADAGVSRAEQAIREARAALSPTLRLGAGFTQFSEAQRVAFPIPGVGGTQAIKTGSASALDVRTELAFPLTSGGRDRALVRAAEAARAGQLRGRDQAESDLVLRVSQAFYRVLAARRLHAAAEEALASARVHRSTSAARVRAGAAPRLDSLQAQVDLARRASALVRAREAVRLARIELESEVGTTLDSTRTPVEPGPPTAELPSPETAMVQALSARPELASLEEALRENEARSRAARAALKPQLNLTATAQYTGPNRDEEYWNFEDQGLKTYRLFGGVGLSMPLYDGGATRARVGELAADRSALGARRDEARLAIRREVEQALTNARVALTLWESDSSRVSAAHEALRLAEAGYKGGTVTATEVRDAESALADARAEEAQSLMDYWSAHAALDHAVAATARKER
jgi:outer membrane protein